MTLLAEISGLKGENLCSALLAHLMLRSPEVRAELIRLVSDRAPHGPIYVQRQFAVFCEESATAGGVDEEASDSKRGRIDIVIETDDAVIGIENKFNAPFQEGQPAGYLGLLEQRTTELARIRGTDFSPALIVLAPERRESEVKAKLHEQNLVGADFLAWETLLRSLIKLDFASPVDRFLVRELQSYAETQIGSVVDLGRLLPHLNRSWVPRGSAVHRDFMNTFVWSLLDERVKESGAYRCAYGNAYYGFYLRPRRDDSADNLWIGFCKRADQPNAAALVLCVRSDPDDPVELPSTDHFQPITQSGWTDYGWSCAELRFDATSGWQEIKAWVEAFAPINALIDRIGRTRA